MVAIRVLVVFVLALAGCSAAGNTVDGAVADAGAADGGRFDAAVDAPAVTCVPSCGSHATCVGAACVCDVGLQGDGFSCHAFWKLIASYPFDIAPLPFSDFSPGQWPVSVGHQRAIFIGVENAMPATYPGWRSLDLATTPPVLSAPLALPPISNNSNEFCTCGFGEHVSSDGGRYVYMFGRRGQRYDVATNMWIGIAPSYDGAFDRGESPQVFLPSAGEVLFFGGRPREQFGTLQTVLRYTVATDHLEFEATPMPAPLTRAVAWLPTTGTTIYVAGGQHDWQGNSTMPHNGIISRPTTSNVWTVHPDAPGDLRYPVGMGDYQGRIWVAARKFAFMPMSVVSLPSKAFFFNPATNTWDRSVFLPTGTLAAVTADGATWALARTENDGVGGFDLYKLMTIDETPEP